jgi:hypothetical protein
MLNKIFPNRQTIILILAIILGAAGVWIGFQLIAPTPVQQEFSRPLQDFLPKPAVDHPDGKKLPL